MKGLIEERENALSSTRNLYRMEEESRFRLYSAEGQCHGRKNFFFYYVLDEIETVDRIKSANFQLRYLSNGSSFIRRENGERLRLHPNFNPTLSGISQFFSGKKVTPPPPPLPPKSEGARTPMVWSTFLPEKRLLDG